MGSRIQHFNKEERDNPVTAMFYHLLAPEGGHPTWEEKLIEKMSKCKVLFSKPRQKKLNQQKQ